MAGGAPLIWLGLLLAGIASCDLVYSLTRRARVAEGTASFAVLVAGIGLGATSFEECLGLLGLAVVVIGWGESVTYGFGAKRFWVPLAVGASALTLVVLLAADDPDGGLLSRILDRTSVPLLGSLSAGDAVLLCGALLLQLSTGNVVVRLVLGATGTVDPRRYAESESTPPALKGGRLLGPMERLLILGLAMAGEVTAASLVIAAKGLLRFPEIQSSGGEPGSPGIHEVTEYFLVGSFVSWTFALASAALVVS